MPFAGLAESGGLEFASKFSTGSDFANRTASLSDSCCAFRPSDFEFPLDDADPLESSSDSAGVVVAVSGAERPLAVAASVLLMSVLAVSIMEIPVARLFA